MPLTIQLQCMHPQCKYNPKPQRLDYTITSNYWTHYKNAHPEIAALYKPNIPQSFSSQSSPNKQRSYLFYTTIVKAYRVYCKGLLNEIPSSFT
jgi:hypothetical protein